MPPLGEYRAEHCLGWFYARSWSLFKKPDRAPEEVSWGSVGYHPGAEEDGLHFDERKWVISLPQRQMVA
jgi:hypothetical protein